MPTVLITGAARGLGLEFVRQYAADGWRVVACCRTASADLQAIDGVEIRTLDVTDHDAIEKLADDLSDTPIDVLLNVAGVNGQLGIDDRSPETQAFGNTNFDNWRKTLEINLLAPMKIAESLASHVMASAQKKIVTLTSEFASMTLNKTGGFHSYRTSKAGVNAMMKSMALDVKEQGILTLALHPGWVQTDMGGAQAPITAETSVRGMRAVIANLTPDQSGQFIAYSGEVLPY